MRSRSIRRYWPVWRAGTPPEPSAPRGGTWRTSAPPCSSADCSRSKMSSITPPLRVGVAGLGVASTFALLEIAAHPRVRLAAAADLRPAAREAFARQYGAPTYDTVEALCESPH